MKPYKIFYLLAFLLAAAPVFADSCEGTSSVAATNQHYKVYGEADKEANKWNYVLVDLQTGEKRTGPFPKIRWHAHLYFFISQDGKRFAVLDASAGHHSDDRFMIYDSAGKLVVSLGMNDILTKDELSKVSYSISHVDWLKPDPVAKSWGKYLAEDNAVSLTTIADREVVIALTDGQVIAKDK
ncbi:MAG: hypothetical protein HYV35_08210 [Lentisphaerae bacterium]|nr:hypothetical protein [Lentisphaerota bacterium]